MRDEQALVPLRPGRPLATVRVLDQPAVTVYLPPSAVLGQWQAPAHPVAGWLANKSTRRNTQETYARQLREFAAWLMRERDKADPLVADFDDLLAWRDELTARGLQASTRMSKLAALSSLYGWLVKRHVLDVSPLDALDLPRPDGAPQRRAWTLEELAAFFGAIPQDGRPQHLRDRALFWLLFRNGLRVSEVVGANVGDLVMKHGARVLELRERGAGDQHIKGGYARDAVLKDATAAVLDLYLAARGLAAGAELATSAAGAWRAWPLFAAAHGAGRPHRLAGADRAPEPEGGRRLTRQNVWLRAKTYGAAAGLDLAAVFPHAGRHTSITFLLDAGVPLLRVKQFSGHHSLKSVEKYAHAREAVTDNAAWQIPY